jgi:hypothetical protein
MKPQVTLREALRDPQLLGSLLVGPSWEAWRVLLIAAMGEPLTAEERVVFKTFTGRDQEPGERVEEFVAIVGRRDGKSRALSVLETYIAGLCDHPLLHGERGLLLCIAPDQRQAKISLDYCAANFEQSPVLRRLIANRLQESLELKNGVTVEVRGASWRRLRGPTYVCCVADESAFWYSDEVSANADSEILAAIRPGLATTGGPLLVASSPYARRGELWESFRKHYGHTGDRLILVAKGASKNFNPSLPQSVVDRAYERDPASAAAEYGGEFRSDLEAFVPLEVVQACIGDFVERAPGAAKRYHAFVDPSGGSADSFTLAISSSEGDKVVIDAVREIKPPFSPEGVVEEFSLLLKSYGLHQVRGDKYAGEWPREQFKKRGITYVICDKSKSDLFRDLLPLLNSGRVVLPKSDRLVNQLAGLERRVARSGKDSIDHGPGSHDDLANAVAGAVDPIAQARSAPAPVFGRQDGGMSQEETRDFWDRVCGRVPVPKIANPQSQPCLVRHEPPKRPPGKPADGFTADQTWIRR